LIGVLLWFFYNQKNKDCVWSTTFPQKVGFVKTSFSGSLLVWWILHTSTFFLYKLIMPTTSSSSSFSICKDPKVINYITFWWNSLHPSMLCSIGLWNLPRPSSFLGPDLFFAGKYSACINMSYSLSMFILKTCYFFPLYSIVVTPPLLEAWSGKRVEIDVGGIFKSYSSCLE